MCICVYVSVSAHWANAETAYTHSLKGMLSCIDMLGSVVFSSLTKYRILAVCIECGTILGIPRGPLSFYRVIYRCVDHWRSKGHFCDLLMRTSFFTLFFAFNYNDYFILDFTSPII